MFLSIIIPVYKVEKYLSHCLDSCLNQNISSSDYEVIAINDGSPDRCNEILQQYSKKYSNIIIINQENQGLSMARNNGLEAATGDYVWFIDSDDSIEDEVLKDILSQLDGYTDIIQINYQLTYEDRGPEIEISLTDHGIQTGPKVFNSGEWRMPAQFAIYRRQFLLDNHLEFKPGILHEDNEFKPRALYLAKSIRNHNPIVYNYLQRSSGSITSSRSLKNIKGFLSAIDSIYIFINKNVNDRRSQIKFRQLLGLYINSVLSDIISIDKSSREEALKLLYNYRHIFKLMIASRSLQYSTEGIILYLNLRLGVKFYKLYKKGTW